MKKLILLLFLLPFWLQAQDTRLMREDARDLMKEGRYTEAIKMYQLLTDIKADDYEAFFKMGQAYSELKQDSLALLNYSKAIDLEPENVYYIYYNRAFSYSNLGDHINAIKDLDTTVKLKSDFADAFNNRGLEREAIGDFKNALSDYTQAINNDSTNWIYYFNIGRIYEKTNQSSLAVSFLSIALTAKPDNKEALKLRGTALAKMKDFERAEKDFSTYLKLQQDDEDVLLKHGFCLILIGEKIKGCFQLELAKEYGNEKAQSLIDQFCGEE